MRLRDSAPTDVLLRKMSKAELHIHIEGSLEPEMMFEMAARNGVRLRYSSVREVREAHDFSDLQSFLDLYYELTWAYLQRAPRRSCVMQRSSSTRRPTLTGV
jgi:adenosine deaminase